MTFLLEIITPDRQVFSETVDALTVPTVNGTIGVMPRHVPLFSSLTEGEVKVTSGQKEYFLAIGGGFMEVTKEKVSVLVSRAYHANELNEADIKKAVALAKEALSRKVRGDELGHAQSLLRRSFWELKVIRRYKAPQFTN